MKKLLIIGLAALPGLTVAQVNYFEDFQGSVGSEWSSSITTDVDGSGRFGLGPFENTTETLTLSGFTVGQVVTLSFDLYLLNTWDGSHPEFGGPDTITVTADGNTLLNASFSTHPFEAWTQTYSAATPLGGPEVPSYTDADEIETLLNYNAIGSAVYNFDGTGNNAAFTFVASATEITFSFTGSGLQTSLDEPWAIDNVRVTNPVPEPATMAALGFGALALMRRRRRS